MVCDIIQGGYDNFLAVMLRISYADIGVMVQGRLKKAEKAYRALFPYLRCQTIPLAARVSVFKAVVVSSAMYGSEIWGMVERYSKDIQLLFNKAMRIMLGSSEKDMSIPVVALWRECNIPPVFAMASGSRARAINKYFHLNTWVGILCRNPVKDHVYGTWALDGVEWMKDESFEGVLREKEYEDDEGDSSNNKDRNYGDKAHRVVLRTLWYRMEQARAKNSKYGSKYLEYKFGKTSWAFMQAFPSNVIHRVVRLYEGFRMLALCRTGGLWTGKKLLGAFDKEGDNIYRNKCFCCNNKVRDGEEEGGAETIRHLIIECKKWGGGG